MATSNAPSGVNGNLPESLPGFRIVAIVAVIEGAALILNGLAVLYFVARDGLTGPSAVASPPGVALEVGIFLLFGAGLVAVALGARQQRDWVLTPFLVAQLLALTVGFPLATGAEMPAQLVGIAIVVMSVAGLLAWGSLLRTRR